jgi:hypothetical protein
MSGRDISSLFFRILATSSFAITILSAGRASGETTVVPSLPGTETAAEIPSGAGGSGGEIRIVIVGNEIPPECISTGLVRYDTAGRLAPGLADTWVEAPSSKSWRFTLRPEIRDADGKLITETEVAVALRTPALRRVFDPPPRRIRVESGAIVLQFATRDRALPRRLAHPAAGIRVPGKASTGPYRVAQRISDRATLARNPHAVVAARPDTVILFLEFDASRAVFLVEAGYADAAPVSDEDLVRLSAQPTSAGRLVAAHSRDLHALSSSRLPTRTLELLRRAIDRMLITRTLLNGRGTPTGPGFRPLSEAERRGLPRRIILRDESGSAAYARLIARVAYDLRRSGIDCPAPAAESTSTELADAAVVRYSVVSEIDLPPSAVPLFAVTPFWFVRHRVIDFAPPRGGVPGWLYARTAS